MNFEELDAHITKHIQGNFNQFDTLKTEVEKLKPGEIYLEIGVDEGKSFRVIHEYAQEGVIKIGIDIHDHSGVPGITIGRAQFMEQEGIVGINRTGFYVHGDADEFSKVWVKPIQLLMIDGHHDYDSVKKNTLLWEGFVPSGGTIIFHDYDHSETKRWLDEHYGDNKELHEGKVIVVRK